MINTDDVVVCADLQDYLAGMTVLQASNYFNGFDSTCRIEIKKDGPAFSSYLVVVRPQNQGEKLYAQLLKLEVEADRIRRELVQWQTRP